ncbi:MAG: hypothetical protein JNK05_17420 [Myxococcales bacterium]|nr:hypothetical protein [Myxococcales bacterium]
MGFGRGAWVLLISCALVACVAPRTRGAECVFNHECDDPLVCSGGLCRAQCATDRDCPSGQQCALAEDARKNVCFDPRGARACTVRTCAAGQRCADGVCVRDCSATCAVGTVCSADGLFCVLDRAAGDGGSDATADSAMDSAMDSATDSAMDAPEDRSVVVDAVSDAARCFVAPTADASVDAGADASVCAPPMATSTSCGAGLELCDGRCVSTSESSAHCGVEGGCGSACAGQSTCVRGVCAPWSVLSVAANSYATYVARSGGRPLLGWGVAFGGALADRASDSETPVEIVGTDGAIDVAAGYRNGCAIVGAARSVRCWGWGMAGVVDATMAHVRREPADVPCSNGAREVAVGENFACALRDGGDVVCWGRTGRGLLGEGPADAGAARFVWEPTVVPIPSGVLPALHITAGDAHACAVTSGSSGNRNVYCWGFDQESVVGRSVVGSVAPPGAVGASFDSPAQTILARSKTTCVTTAFGSVYCWGENTSGVADPAATGGGNVVEPRMVAGFPGDFRAASLGALDQARCAIERCGRVFCWGNDFERSLSVLVSAGGLDAGGSMRLRPTQITNGAGPLYPGLVAVQGMLRGGCALRADRTLDCWGASDRGSVGSSRVVSSPTW